MNPDGSPIKFRVAWGPRAALHLSMKTRRDAQDSSTLKDPLRRVIATPLAADQADNSRQSLHGDVDPRL